MQDRQAVIDALATTAQAATILLHRALSGDLDVMEWDERAALIGDLHAAPAMLEVDARQKALRGRLQAV